MNNSVMQITQIEQESIMDDARKEAQPFIDIMNKITFESSVSLSIQPDGTKKIVYSYEVDPYYILAKDRVKSIFEQAQALINKCK